MAQWLAYRNQDEQFTAVFDGDRQAEAMQFYIQVAQNPDSYHASGAVIEGFGRELKSNPEQAEIQLLKIEKEAPSADTRLAAQFLIAKARYKARNWGVFLQRAAQISKEYDQSEKTRRAWFFDLALELEELEKWAKVWRQQDVVIETSNIRIVSDYELQKPLERRIFVDSAAPAELKVAVEGDANRIDVRVEPSAWSPELEVVRHQQIVVVIIKPGDSQVDATIQISKVDAPSRAEQIKVEVTRAATTKVSDQGEA